VLHSTARYALASDSLTPTSTRYGL
jgi:hypothetical protein